MAERISRISPPFRGRITVGVGGGLDGIQQLHVADIIQVDLVLQNHHEPFSIQANRQDRGWEGELAYRRMSLHAVEIH